LEKQEGRVKKYSNGKNTGLHWRVNTPGLLEEILSNDSAAILKIPLQIFGRLLSDVAERAAAINDPELNKLMMRLALYEVADPNSDKYDSQLVIEYLKRAM
jgi:hypothetical protein